MERPIGLPSPFPPLRKKETHVHAKPTHAHSIHGKQETSAPRRPATQVVESLAELVAVPLGCARLLGRYIWISGEFLKAVPFIF